jgi:protein-tyrosine phosphatase
LKRIMERLRKSFTPDDAKSTGTQSLPLEHADHRILFVCMGNICRSPTAEGVFRKVIAEHAPDLSVTIDSAGTHAYHVGEPPDPRAVRAAQRRGVDISSLRARVVVPEDFGRFDLLLAMDELNIAMLHDLAGTEHQQRVRLFLDFAPGAGRTAVPDPYYGGSNGFEYVLDLVEEASMGLLRHLQESPARKRVTARTEQG